MTITITTSTAYEHQLKIECNHPAFIEKYGNSTGWTSRAMLFANMRRLSTWCSTIGEECKFEVK